MRISNIALAFLTASLFCAGCKKPPPAVPPTGAPTSTAPTGPAGPAAPDRSAAKTANTAGMKLYKEKNFPGAAEQFRAAVKADSGFILARYNLACVAGLTKDRDTLLAQLEYLAQSPEAYAHAKLAKALGDSDLKDYYSDPKIWPLLRWGDMFMGYRALAFRGKPTDAQIAALKKQGAASGCEADQADDVNVVQADLFADSPGAETLLVSLAQGMVVQSSDGKVLVKSGAPDCEGLQDIILDVSVGQVVPDPEPEIAIHYTTGGRVGVEHIMIYKRKAKDLVKIVDVTLYDPGRKWKAAESWEELAKTGKLVLSPDGLLHYKSEDEKSNELRKWDPAKFEFVPAPVEKKVAAAKGGLPDDWEMRDGKSGPCGCMYPAPKGFGKMKFTVDGDKIVGELREPETAHWEISVEPSKLSPKAALKEKLESVHSKPNEPAGDVGGWLCQDIGGEDGEWYGVLCLQQRDHPAGGKQIIAVEYSHNFDEPGVSAETLVAVGAQLSGFNAKKGK